MHAHPRHDGVIARTFNALTNLLCLFLEIVGHAIRLLMGGEARGGGGSEGRDDDVGDDERPRTCPFHG